MILDTEKKLRNFVIGVKILLYAVVSIISTIHVVDFFALTNPYWLAISLAIAFEIGAAASLASILVLPKAKQTMVWIIFIILTLTQSMGNMYYAYDNAANFESWMELFGLTEFSVIEQKRILSIASGAILPIIALGFIKSLVDYLKPDEPETTVYQEITRKEDSENKIDTPIETPKEEENEEDEQFRDLHELEDSAPKNEELKKA